MSKLKVAALQGLSASSDAITLANDGTCTANITNNLSNRNLVINGAMQVAQRGTSSTSSGYQTVDRFTVASGNTDETPTQAQVDLTSSDTPYSYGFRKALKITNGNQTSGAGANDYIEVLQKFEGQDINTSGWDFTSASSFITISFWIKSSVAQTFYGSMRIKEASANKQYVFAISATTSWQKITKTIPGASGLNPVNTNALGGWFDLIAFYGTGYTGSMTPDQWNTVDTSAYIPDMTSTWYTTNDATLEYTGLQIEVGSVATDFEHRSYGDELHRCARYYQKQLSGSGKAVASAFAYSTTYGNFSPHYPMGPMRTAPSLDQVNGADYYEINGGLDHGDHLDGAFIIEHGSETTCNIYFDPDGGLNNGYSFYIRSDHASAYYAYSAEL